MVVDDQSTGRAILEQVVRSLDERVVVEGFARPVDAVVWATGYKDESDWVAIPEVKDEHGRFVHQHGVSPIPNLYFIGRSWQWTRGWALLVGVGADAAYLAEHIVKHLDERAVA